MSTKFNNISGYPEIINNKNMKKIEQICEAWAVNFGAVPVVLPVIERKELFERSVGNGTDIVDKEMLSLKDETLVLRPEGTAGIMRAWNNNGGMRNLKQQKWFYNDYMFRNETPQAGRFKQFKQFGIECLGYQQGITDIDLLVSLDNLFVSMNIRDKLTLRINTIGTVEERNAYIEILKSWLYKNKDNFDDLSKERIDKNPLRIFDTKTEKTKELLKDAPLLFDTLSEESLCFFNLLCTSLSKMNVLYTIDYTLVRGLDYYNGLVFEFVTSDEKSQNTVAAGGRYDKLSKIIGGDSTDAIGFAIGLERLSYLYNNNEFERDGYYVCWRDDSLEEALRFANTLRTKNRVEIDCGISRLNKQLKRADEKMFKYAVIIGKQEVIENKATIKNLYDGEEIKICLV